MKKIILYSAVTLVILALIAWKLNSNQQENAARVAIVAESNSGVIPILTTTVAYTAADREFVANGHFQAVKQIDFSAETPGRITRLLVKEGSVVKAGQVLAETDSRVANADLQSAKTALTQAKLDMERFQKALASGGVTQKQADEAKVQYEAAQARYTQAGKIDGNTRLTAPISGVINTKYVETGSYLAAGTKLFEIVDISRLKLVVSVPEAQVVQLQPGQQVSVTTHVFPETEYTGTITFIAVKGDAALNYPVEVEIPNLSNRELKAGMYGTARFELPASNPEILIPRSAFYNGVNSGTIFVLQADKAQARKVTAGRIYGDKVEIREGLKPGETVITSGQINLKDGTPVTVQKNTPENS